MFGTVRVKKLKRQKPFEIPCSFVGLWFNDIETLSLNCSSIDETSPLSKVDLVG